MEGKTPAYLADRIMAEVVRIERRRLAWRLAAFAVLLAASAGVVVYAGFEAVAAAYRSGFAAFASLLFTDFAAATADLSDFAWSLLESFPLVPAIGLFAGAFFVVWSAGGVIAEASLLGAGDKFSPARA